MSDEAAWIRKKLGLHPNATKGDVQGALHVLCSEAQGHRDYIAAFKCDDKQGRIGRLCVEIAHMSQRIEELEETIKSHRSQKADDRCIEDDDRLYAVLGDGIKCDRRVGDKAAMLRNCERFIDRRCEGGHWPTYADLEAKVQALESENERLKQAGTNPLKGLT